jgi:hypothetical protein
MPDRLDLTAVRRRGAGERPGVVLAVCHASGDVERRVAARRRAGRVRTALVSYASDPDRELADLSRAPGFSSHLRAPLSPSESKPPVTVTMCADPETRLRHLEGTLRSRFAGVESLLEFGDALRIQHRGARARELIVATLPDVAASAEGLIEAADKARYWVKVHGKDGLHVATEDD